MPRLSVWAIRTALVHLLIGFTFGALLLVNKGHPFWAGVWLLLPAHIEMLLAGWMANLALGTAFWILPRFPGGSRGNVPLAWAALLLFNAGILLVIAASLLPGLQFTGRILQAAAAGFFILHAWGRVKPLYPKSG